MTIECLGDFYNLSSLLAILGATILFARYHRVPILRPWVRAYACGGAMLVPTTFGHFGISGTWLSAIQYALMALAAYWSAQAALLVLKWPTSSAQVGLWAMVAFVLSLGLLALGVPEELAGGVLLLGYSVAIGMLGWAVLQHGGQPRTLARWIVGGPLLALSVAPVAFPFFYRMRSSWLDYWLGNILALLAGVGMILYVMELAARDRDRLNGELIALSDLKAGFVSTVSHELRTPLTSVVGYLEFLQDRIGGPLTEQQSEFVEQMCRSSRQLTDLIESLLDTAQLESGHMRVKHEPVDLAQVLEQAARPMGAQFEKKGLALRVLCEPGLPPADADAQRLVQVLNNLLVNAIKFTEADGVICLGARRLGASLEIEVCDTGIGIEPQDLSKVFDAFYQVDSSLVRRHGGTGLGLSIVKRMVEAMGASIDLSSEPGVGTTFRLLLPIWHEAAVPAGSRAYQVSGVEASSEA